MIHEFYWKFRSLFSGKRILKNQLRFDEVTAMSLVEVRGTLFGTRCILLSCHCSYKTQNYLLAMNKQRFAC